MKLVIRNEAGIWIRVPYNKTWCNIITNDNQHGYVYPTKDTKYGTFPYCILIGTNSPHPVYINKLVTLLRFMAQEPDIQDILWKNANTLPNPHWYINRAKAYLLMPQIITEIWDVLYKYEKPYFKHFYDKKKYYQQLSSLNNKYRKVPYSVKLFYDCLTKTTKYDYHMVANNQPKIHRLTKLAFNQAHDVQRLNDYLTINDEAPEMLDKYDKQSIDHFVDTTLEYTYEKHCRIHFSREDIYILTMTALNLFKY